MSKNNNLRRQPTKRELDAEKLPDCMWDPAKISVCRHYKEPDREKCFECLKGSVIDELEERCASEAMRWFLALLNLIDDKKTGDPS